MTPTKMSRATAKVRTQEIVNARAALAGLMATAREREIWQGLELNSWEEWLTHVEKAVKVVVTTPAPRIRDRVMAAPWKSGEQQVNPLWKSGGKKEHP